METLDRMHFPGRSMSDIISEHIITAVASILSVLMSAVALIKVIWFTPKEARKIDAEGDKTTAEADRTEAETAVQYEDALRRANERAESIEARMSRLETRIADRDKRIEDLECANQGLMEKLRDSEQEKKNIVEEFRQELAQRDRELAKVKDWAERLVFQVKSMGGIPIPFDKNDPPSTPRPKKKP